MCMVCECYVKLTGKAHTSQKQDSVSEANQNFGKLAKQLNAVLRQISRLSWIDLIHLRLTWQLHEINLILPKSTFVLISDC